MTDSEYLKNGITSWIANWKRRGWMTSQKKPVINRDLWEQLDALAQPHEVTWKWAPGHMGHPDQERCDLVAKLHARNPGRRNS